MPSVRHKPAMYVVAMLAASAMAVFTAVSPASAARSASAQWAVTSSPDMTVSGASPSSVSCASATACTAVGHYANTSGISEPMASTWNGKSWRAQSVTSPRGGGLLSSVSCPSASLCEAVGQTSAGSLVAEKWNGKSWTPQAVATPAHSLGASFSGISCVSATFCEAVGNYHIPGNLGEVLPMAVFAAKWNGIAWSLQSVAVPAGAEAPWLGGISCTSAKSCEAIGGQPGGPTPALSFAEAWNGSSWQLQAVPASAGLDQGGVVSCASPGFCAAVGDSHSGASGGAVWNGTAWRAQHVPSPAGQPAFTALSCVSAKSCQAVGQYITTATPSVVVSLAEAWNGTTWSLQSAPSPANASSVSLAGVSCASASACEVVGDFTGGLGGAEISMADGWNGHSWAAQQLPDFAEAASNSLSAVSCVTAAFCEAVGFAMDSSGNEISLAEGWNGKIWAIQATPDTAAFPGDSSLNSVSCASAKFCEAVGDVAGLPGAWQWNGTSWKQQAMTTATPGDPTSVSCTSADFCMAAGRYFGVNVWNGASWSAISMGGFGNTNPYSVSCTSADFCETLAASATTGGTADSALAWNGTSWSTQYMPTQMSTLSSVSCTSADFCELVGETSQQLPGAQVWNGSNWSPQPVPSPAGFGPSTQLLGISCVSAASCTSVGQVGNGDSNTLAAVWDGKSWGLQATPNPSAGMSGLTGVSCPAIGVCTAVGGTTDAGLVQATLVEDGD